MLPQPGKDILIDTEITFQESYTGTQRTFTIQSHEACKQCHGTGQIRRSLCSVCRGARFVLGRKRVAVNIPAGVDTGMFVRVSGEGGSGLFGGSPGNLYVRILDVTPDPAFGRDKNDLYVWARVEQDTATFGGEIPVQMPDGSSFIVNAPKGLEDGIRVRTRNMGMPIPKTEQRGDLYVTVKIVPNEVKPPRRKPAVVAKKPAAKPLVSPSLSGATRINTTLGNYHLLQLLGSGGFADVFLAEHIYLHTHVAIKIVHEKIKAREAQEFLQEAQTIAALKHPHIVRILDYGVEQDTTTPYLVMDYAPDGSLQDRHPEGQILPLDRILSYAKQIAVALDYAHTQKVIHRDVKPANMLVEADHLLLSDFGIAVSAHTTKSLVTQDAIGTVTYMAPEQIRKKPRPASDQYSLAVVVYEWLCGEAPFTGDLIEIAMKHVSEDPPSLCTRVSTISTAVEHVVFKALSKDPDQRFQMVQAFVDALEQASTY